MEFATAYSVKERVVTINNEPSKTKQSLKDEADVNKIIKKYGYSHVVANMNKLEVLYGDITSRSLEEALQLNIDAQEAFMEVPSEIRKQFGNDPGDRDWET